MDDLNDVIANLSIKSKNFIDEAAKSLTPTMVGFKREPERNQNCTYFMQNTCQLYQNISKSHPKIENSVIFDEDFVMHMEPEIKVECSVDDPNKEVQMLLYDPKSFTYNIYMNIFFLTQKKGTLEAEIYGSFEAG